MLGNRVRTAFATAALASLLAGCDLDPNRWRDATPEIAPGEVLVKFRDAISAQQIRTSLSSAEISRLEHFEAIGVYRCRVASTARVQATLRTCREDPSIEYAEPNYIYTTSSPPDDPRFGDLWAMENANDADIDAVEAWDVQTGSRRVLIAIVDTGVDYDHEDLQANMWRNPGESGEGRETNGVDDDGNGFVDDVFGWDFEGDDNDPMDDNGHGSHVAGTVAAIGDNGKGVAGVNWRASIMALKFLDGSGRGTAADAIGAILYAAENGAAIQNNSWGGGGSSQALKEAIQFARDRNSLFVAAAGNDGRNNDANPHYPSGYDVANVLAVAASDRNDRLASFSNFGKETVDLVAPGVDIWSCQPRNRYQSLSGTSMATPHVSGVAGLVLAQYPDLTYRQIMIRIDGGVDRNSTFESNTVTGGRLNALNALSTDPRIAFVTQWKTTPDTAGPYRVEAEATDDGGISLATLSYSVDGGDLRAVSMQPISPHTYRAEIPGQALGAVISYFVEATDDQGHTSRSAAFRFEIGEETGGPECGRIALAVTDQAGPGAHLGLLVVSMLLGLVCIRVAKRSRAT